MTLRATPESAILFTKMSVALICAWPPPKTATKKKLQLFRVLQTLILVNAIFLWLPLLYAIYVYRNDFIELAKCLPLLGAVTQVVFKVSVCYAQRSQMQTLLKEAEDFCKSATKREYEVLQSYVDRHKCIHVAYTICSYFTTLAVICAPLYLPQKLPTLAVYPFPVDQQPLRAIVFVQQALVGFQVSAGLSINCQIALLLWYAAVQFELLISDMARVTNKQQLDACIKRHIKLLRYTDRLNLCVRLLICSTVTTTSVASIFGCLIFITNQPLMLKVMFFVVVFTAGAELLISAWSTESLMHMSTQVAWGVYEWEWFKKNVKARRNVLFTIMRAQKPQTISIQGVLPSLSLKYYASFLYTSFSYYTALRVLLDKGKI